MTVSWWWRPPSRRCGAEKDDVTEVREGFECGMTLSNYNDIRIGDVIETFEMVERERS